MYLEYKDKYCVIPERAVVQITGEDSEPAIRSIFELLARDCISAFADLDAQVGLPYHKMTDEVSLVFNNKSKLVGSPNGVSVIESNDKPLPKYHGLFYIGKGRVRSFAITNSIDPPFVAVPAHYTSDITDITWYRIVQYLNTYTGFEFVKKVGNEVKIDTSGCNGFSQSELEFIYTFMTEAIITPKSFCRILLFDKLDDVLTPEHWVSLINFVCGLPQHEVCILPDVGVAYSGMLSDMAEVHFLKK